MLTQTYQLASLSLWRLVRLLLAGSCCLVFTALTQAQSSSYDFLVPGTSGPNWVDTNLYLPPNTFLQISAVGKVDVSAGWGSHGPEGTSRSRCAPVRGYPVEVDNCYGLVARLTNDATLPTPSSPE